MNTNNTVKKALSFGKGLTNVPSDFLSTDEELTESAGLIMKDGEMVPIQRPVSMGGMDAKLIFVHKLADVERYIFYNEGAKTIRCCENVGSQFNVLDTFSVSGKITDIAAVSAMVVLATTEGLAYLHLKNGTYKFFQGEMPRPKVNISFDRLTNTSRIDKIKDDDRTLCEMRDVVNESNGTASYGADGYYIPPEETAGTTTTYTSEYYRISVKTDTADAQKNFDDVIQGHIAQTINWTKKNGIFTFPFLARYALKMYDGSYACISPPILCLPTNNRNFRMTPAEWDKKTRKYKYLYTVEKWGPSRMYDIDSYEMIYSCSFPDKDFWEDLVVGIVVFATEQVIPFKLTEGYGIKQPDEVYKELYANNGIADHYQGYKFRFAYNTYRAQSQVFPTYKSDKEIIDELMDSSRFYKLFEIPLDECDGKTHYTILPEEGGDYKKIREGVLTNLAQQEQLANDDYYGWTKKIPNGLYTYNKRLNMIGVKRCPKFAGTYQLSTCNSIDTFLESPLVHIVSDLVDTWVYANVVYDNQLGPWFYYPDPNAKEVLFYNARKDITYPEGMKFAFKRVKLKPHPYLNGAYFFDAIPTDDTSYSTPNEYYAEDITKSFSRDGYEYLDSQILTSVVNNPFVFQSNGDNTVGTGSIIGIVANTEPVSQGQFGQYPLFVFTTEGIYGLSVDSEGLYAASYPVSREVCNNAGSITPTDRLVFFTSEKGLMAISGGTAQCVSTQLQGPTPRNFNAIGDGDFRAFLKDCMLAYDYRESLIRIYSPTHDYHYVYNMRDQTFAKASNENATALAVASSYPDDLIQESDGKVYSMLSKPDINADTRTYSGTFTTRPLKLGSSLELKTIRQILHFFNSDEGRMQLRIFASDDCRTWRELKSVHGKPWLFYVFRYDLSDLKASDSFAGTALSVETRFNDKMR